MKIIAYFLILGLVCPLFSQQDVNYEKLHEFFFQWRNFESPPLRDGAPDYTKGQFNKRRRVFKSLERKLANIDTSGWSRSAQADYRFIRAEMNGYEFNERVLKSWERDPAFYQTVWTYQSDVPAHEGPTNHALLEYWQYSVPLKGREKDDFIRDLRVIPSLLEQARINLTGNARDLWVAGIRDIEDQGKNLKSIEKTLLKHHNQQSDIPLFDAMTKARVATADFVAWLKDEAPSKTGPSGIGKENYSWYQKNVHLVPLTWEEEVQLLERELYRAWSFLKLEEHRNRNLPHHQDETSPYKFAELTEKAVN